MKHTVLCCIMCYAAPMAAQMRPAEAPLEAGPARGFHDVIPGPGVRDPQVARRLRIVLPGAGHFYAGEDSRGYGLLASALGGLVLGPAVYRMDDCSWTMLRSLVPCEPEGPRWPYRVTGAAFVITVLPADVGHAA